MSRAAEPLFTHGYDLSDEEVIMWDQDPATLPYVRQIVIPSAPTRRRPISWRGWAGRRVGYAVLRPDAISRAPGAFFRRAFWIAEHDRSEQPDGVYGTGCPSEGVDPLTVKPGVWGEITERAWGTPFDTESA